MYTLIKFEMKNVSKKRWSIFSVPYVHSLHFLFLVFTIHTVLLDLELKTLFCFRPVIIEVPHFASLRGRERELVVLRCDNGTTWREHTLDANEEAVQEVLNESFEGEGSLFVLSKDVSETFVFVNNLQKM